LSVFGCEQKTAEEQNLPVLSGEYLGQSPPGLTAELFGSGFLSTEMPELNAVFFPGGREVIFSVTVGPMKWALVMMREEDGRWTPPETASFSGKYGGVDPCVSSDGNTVFFCSNRPRPGSTDEEEEDYDIWSVTRTDAGWTEPVNLGFPVNTETHEFYPSLTREGTLYFQSRREGGFGGADIYRARLVDGKYEIVEHLPDPVNTPDFEGDAFIAPDESYIIVSTYRKEENYGQSDLYIGFRMGEDTWSPLKNMGSGVNSAGGENCQILSPCGKYLFFTSRRYRNLEDGIPSSYEALLRLWRGPQNGGGDAYWVDARIIDSLRLEQ
jgi:hypothetical protein